MPKKFVQCVERGGRVRTISLDGSKYIKVCYLDGHSYRGEVHTKKKKGK